jgi:hypothetical protein
MIAVIRSMHVINWFKVFTIYLNVRIDLSKFIRIFNYDGG